jgi:hypothetical protein
LTKEELKAKLLEYLEENPEGGMFLHRLFYPKVNAQECYEALSELIREGKVERHAIPTYKLRTPNPEDNPLWRKE